MHEHDCSMQERNHSANMVSVKLHTIWLGLNWFSTYSIFTISIRQGKTTEIDPIKRFQFIIYILQIYLNSVQHIQCNLIKAYTHVLANTCFLGDYLTIHGWIWCILTCKVKLKSHLSRRFSFIRFLKKKWFWK